MQSPNLKSMIVQENKKLKATTEEVTNLERNWSIFYEKLLYYDGQLSVNQWGLIISFVLVNFYRRQIQYSFLDEKETRESISDKGDNSWNPRQGRLRRQSPPVSLLFHPYSHLLFSLLSSFRYEVQAFLPALRLHLHVTFDHVSSLISS
jgi:hypothetical protein